MSVEMKNLNINGTNFEIVDAKSRNDIGSLKDDIGNISKQLNNLAFSVQDGCLVIKEA